MCSTLTLVAFAALLATPQTLGKPLWSTDYLLAQQQQRTQGKPLAVFIGSGAAGWQQVCQSGKLHPEAERLLSKHYVCLYADRDTAAGRRLADALAIASGAGLVISDRSGQFQAFHHRGQLTDEQLTSRLTRFADPSYTLGSTETIEQSTEVTRVSYYPPAPGSVPQSWTPAWSTPSWQGGHRWIGGRSFGGGCSSGRCGR